MCCGITLLHIVNICCSHWLIKKLLWPIARQNIARWGSQTEYRKKEGQSRERHKPTAQETRCQQTGKTHSHVTMHRLVEMG